MSSPITFFVFARSGHAWDALPEKHQSANGNRRSRPSDSVGHRALKPTSDIFPPEVRAGRLCVHKQDLSVDATKANFWCRKGSFIR